MTTDKHGWLINAESSDRQLSRRYRTDTGRIMICPPEVTERFEWAGFPGDFRHDQRISTA